MRARELESFGTFVTCQGRNLHLRCRQSKNRNISIEVEAVMLRNVDLIEMLLLVRFVYLIITKEHLYLSFEFVKILGENHRIDTPSIRDVRRWLYFEEHYPVRKEVAGVAGAKTVMSCPIHCPASSKLANRRNHVVLVLSHVCRWSIQLLCLFLCNHSSVG